MYRICYTMYMEHCTAHSICIVSKYHDIGEYGCVLCTVTGLKT